MGIRIEFTKEANMISLLCLLTSLLLVIVLISPFFLGSGGMLSYTSTIRDLGKLQREKSSILREFLRDEACANKGEISDRVWMKRQSFLFHRYADIARQIDGVMGKDGQE